MVRPKFKNVPDDIARRERRVKERITSSASRYVLIKRFSAPDRECLTKMVERGEAEIFSSQVGLAYRLRAPVSTDGAEDIAPYKARVKELEDRATVRLGTLDRMDALLTQTANALKGEPEPDTEHAWEDLPEVAQRLVTRVRELEDAINGVLKTGHTNLSKLDEAYNNLEDKIR